MYFFLILARTLCSTRCPIWPSEGAASVTAMRLAAVRRRAMEDSVANADTTRSAQTARDADHSITTDRGPGPPHREQTNVFVSSS